MVLEQTDGFRVTWDEDGDDMGTVVYLKKDDGWTMSLAEEVHRIYAAKSEARYKEGYDEGYYDAPRYGDDIINAAPRL